MNFLKTGNKVSLKIACNQTFGNRVLIPILADCFLAFSEIDKSLPEDGADRGLL